MNAVVEKSVVQQGEAVRVALAAIFASPTNPRKHFEPKALEELTANVAKHGVLQPVLVRPHPKKQGAYELVAGERRWRAATAAKLPEIHAVVRNLTDAEALELQVIENLHRQDLHPMEEAEGYEALEKMKLPDGKPYTVADIAAKVAKSPSYVYQRMSLCKLVAENRKMFFDGKLSLSLAIIASRIIVPELQKRFVREVTGADRDGEFYEAMSAREAQAHAQQHYMLRLSAAPFSTKDEKLVAKAGDCVKCPKRTGNAPDLFPDVKATDTCTDPDCFASKCQAHFATARKDLEAKGRKVIHGDEAKKLFRNWNDPDSSLVHNAPFHNPKDTLYGDYGSPTYGKRVLDIVGKDFKTTLIEHPLTGKMVEVVANADIQKAAKAMKGGKGKKSTATRSIASKPKGPDVDQQLTERLAVLLKQKAPKDLFTKAWLLRLTGEVFEAVSYRDLDAVAKAWDWKGNAFRSSNGYGSKIPAEVAKLNERDLMLFLFHLMFARGAWSRGDVLKMFGIKEADERQTVIDMRAAAAKKAREDAAAAKKAKAKAAPAKAAKPKAAKKK